VVLRWALARDTVLVFRFPFFFMKKQIDSWIFSSFLLNWLVIFFLLLYFQTTVSQSTLFDHLINIWEFRPGPVPGTCDLYFLVDFKFQSPLYSQVWFCYHLFHLRHLNLLFGVFALGINPYSAYAYTFYSLALNFACPSFSVYVYVKERGTCYFCWSNIAPQQYQCFGTFLICTYVYLYPCKCIRNSPH
jgi:hypothetical protein